MTTNNEQEGLDSIYDFDKHIESKIQLLKKDKSENSKQILDFYNYLVDIGLAKATQNTYLFRIIKISKLLKKDFSKATDKDIKSLIEKHNITSIKDKLVLKKFYQWSKGYETTTYPPEVDWIKIKKNRNNKHKQPEDLLSDEDIEKMIAVTTHPRNKAFVLTLAESGCRIGEILTLQIKNLNFDERGCFFLIDGKTGTRRVRVVNSAPYLQNWLNHHPEKNNPEAPLWVVIGTTQEIAKMEKNEKYKYNWSYNLKYAAARALLIRIGKKAGITKKINPHNFRHSRATSLGAGGLNESILNQIMGWKQGSGMATCYIHLSGKQTDDALLPALYGMQVKEQKEKQPKMFPIKCINCGELNPYDVTRCRKCNNLIGVINTKDIEENNVILQMSNVLKNLIDNDGNLKQKIVDDIRNQVRTQEIRKMKKEILQEIKVKTK